MDLGPGTLFNGPSPAQLLRKGSSKRRSAGLPAEGQFAIAHEDEHTPTKSLAIVDEGGSEQRQNDTTSLPGSLVHQNSIPNFKIEGQSTFLAEIILQTSVVVQSDNIENDHQSNSHGQPATGIAAPAQENLNDMLQIGKVNTNERIPIPIPISESLRINPVFQHFTTRKDISSIIFD